MATWKNRLRPGSFRGVRFYMESSEVEPGRRVIVHEFPDREDVVTQDDGRAPRRFSMQVYVIGPNYDQTRDALESAIRDTAGPGTMVHPYRGAIQVTILPGCKVVEKPDEGGIARFTFTAVEQAPAQPSAAPATGTQLTALTNSVTGAATANFGSAFSILGMPANYVASAIARVQETAVFLERVQAGVGGALNVVDLAADGLEAFAEGAAALVTTPLALAAEYQALCEGVLGAGLRLVDTAKRGVRTVRDAAQLYQNRAITQATATGGATMHTVGRDDPPIDTSTPLAAREAANLRALTRLVRVSATASLARTAVRLPFTSRQEAIAFRTQLSAQIEELIGDVDDDTFRVLTAMRASAAEHLARVASTLPELRTFRVPAPVSTLLVAHWLYGDARREDEIIVRNAPRHPGMLGFGDELEVTA